MGWAYRNVVSRQQYKATGRFNRQGGALTYIILVRGEDISPPISSEVKVLDDPSSTSSSNSLIVRKSFRLEAASLN